MLVKRYIVFMLAAAAAVQSLVSCEESNADHVITDTGSVSHTTATVTAEPPVFEKQDMEGMDFNFLIYNEHATDYVDSYIMPDLETGDVISKAVDNRNSATSEMFNITVTADEVFLPKNEATRRIQSGQVDFDVIYEWGSRMTGLALDGYLYSFDELDGVDLARSYWIPSAKEDLTVGDKMYIATNYITMNSLGWAEFIFYNKSMYESLGYTYSLYGLVDQGMWTFDNYVDIAVAAAKDLDGDGVMTTADRYGIWGDINGCLTSFAGYAGIRNTEKNGDGSYTLSIYSEVAVNIYTRFREKLESSNTFISYDQIWAGQPNLTEYESRYIGARFLGFGEGHVLFMPGTMDMTREFVDMEDDYGVVPNPLYSSEQTVYNHFVDVNAPMFAVPAQSEDLAQTGAVLEYMAYKSEEYLLPAFYDVTIKSKRMSDERDYRMLDIVKNSIRYEWTHLYGLEVTNSIIGKMMTTGNFNSVYGRLSTKAKDEIKNCVNALDSIA